MNNLSVRAELIGLGQIVQLLAEQLCFGKEKVTPVMLESVSKNIERIAREVPGDFASYESGNHIF